MTQLIAPALSKKNFRSFLWHAGFLALAQSFLDIDTIVPAMLIEAGGSSMHIGLMAAILTGGSSLSQILFAPYVSNKPFKKRYLLYGINIRMFSLLGLGMILFFLTAQYQANLLWLIFLFISIFAVGGAFANISYTDIIGKSVLQDRRKAFFSSKQILTGIVLVISAFMAKKVISSTEFPNNYAYAIFIGFFALSIASLGFWNIKEKIPATLPIRNFREFINIMRSELRNNPRLGYFLGFVNTQGVVIGFLPFVILYSKEFFQLDSSGTGTLLVYKIIGSLLISIFIFTLSKGIK
ncbi:MAG: MFS transporter, partial [Bacteroidetes bacterium]|nr:MFS transporter [Bacteroidota bacterium]